MFHARTVMTAVSMLAVGLVAAASASSAQAHPATAKAANTTVTIKVANCEGCQVYVSSVMAADYEDVWEGPGKSVRNGEVSFKVPTDRTAGMSIAIDTPWDGAVPYQTLVALRYKGFKPGDQVSYSEINDATRASGVLGRNDRRRRHHQGQGQEGHRDGPPGAGHGHHRLRQDHARTTCSPCSAPGTASSARRTSSAAARRTEGRAAPVRPRSQDVASLHLSTARAPTECWPVGSRGQVPVALSRGDVTRRGRCRRAQLLPWACATSTASRCRAAAARSASAASATSRRSRTSTTVTSSSRPGSSSFSSSPRLLVQFSVLRKSSSTPRQVSLVLRSRGRRVDDHRVIFVGIQHADLQESAGAVRADHHEQVVGLHNVALGRTAGRAAWRHR